ncbi:MAG: hypothetical protein QF590_04485 [Dehalococcoidia bacterium]|jgi:hypothetical protein|nr:hypothetical protein [Dehalococcoidia bacterium]
MFVASLNNVTAQYGMQQGLDSLGLDGKEGQLIGTLSWRKERAFAGKSVAERKRGRVERAE